MKKKDIVRDALLTARDIERAAKRNAQNIVMEAFMPRLEDVIRQTLNEEGPGPQLADPVSKLAKGEEEETESSEVQNSSTDSGYPNAIAPTQGDKELSGKGGKSSLDRPAPKPGQMTEEEDEELGLDMMDEDDDMDLDDMDDMPVEGTGRSMRFELDLDGEDDEVEESAPSSDHDVGQIPGDLSRDAGSNDHNEEDFPVDESEGEYDDDEMELDLDMDESDDTESELDAGEDEAGEELEIPDELFDDADDQEAAPEDQEDPFGEGEDEELDLDVVDDEEPEMAEMDMMGGEEEFEEGLYVRREGKFTKVDPSQALEQRMNDLEEERNKLANAVGFLKGQLGEVNVYNAKLAHLVKLYESGLFKRAEKRLIAEKLDACKSVKQVKRVYTSIVKEAQSRTVLDDISDVINENRRIRRNVKPTGESVYQSAEVRRMRHLAGLDD